MDKKQLQLPNLHSKKVGEVVMKSVLGIVFIWSISVVASPSAPNRLIQEPVMASALEWDATASDFLKLSYDLNGNGKPDYFTGRRIFLSFFSVETLDEVKQSFPDNIIFQIPQETPGAYFYYIANPKPLFYAIDSDENGSDEYMYIDQAEDGVNGNEEIMTNTEVW